MNVQQALNLLLQFVPDLQQQVQSVIGSFNIESIIQQALSIIPAQLASFIEPLTSQLTALLGKRRLLSGNVIQTVQSVVNELQSIVPTIQSQLTGILSQLSGPLANFQTQISGFLTNLGIPQSRENLLASAQQLIGQFSGLIGGVISQVQNQLTNITSVLNNLGLGSILGSVVGKRGVFDDLLASLSGVVNQVTGAVTNVVGSLTTVGGALVDSVTPHLQDLQDQLTNHALNAAQSLLGTLAGISGTLQGKRQLADAFGSLLNEALGHLTDIATSLLNVGLASVLGALSGKRSIIDDMINGVSSAINAVIAQVTAIGGAIAVSLLPILQDLQSQLTNHGINAVQSVVSSLASISSTLQGKRQIADAFGALLDEALGHLTSIATSLLNVGLASVLGALAGKRGVFDDLFASLSGVVNQVTGTVSTVVGSLGQVGGALLDSVTPHLQDLQDQLTNHALNAAQSLLGTLAGISGTLQG